MLFGSAERGSLKVLGVGGSTIEERDLAIFPVKTGGGVLEAITTLLEFVAPSLMTDLLPVTRGTSFVGGE